MNEYKCRTAHLMACFIAHLDPFQRTFDLQLDEVTIELDAWYDARSFGQAA